MKKIFTLLLFCGPILLFAQDSTAIVITDVVLDEELQELRERFSAYSKTIKEERVANTPNPDQFTWDEAVGNTKSMTPKGRQQQTQKGVSVDDLYLGPAQLQGQAPKDKNWENQLTKNIKKKNG